jgi:rhamnosyltransferase
MSSKINFAVLLAAKDSMPWLKSQIISILNQKKVKLKIYISIDQSNDDTYKFCKSLSYGNENIKIFLRQKKFSSPSRNFFWMLRKIDLSNYDYIALADHDDIWSKKKLIYAQKSLLKNRCDGYSSNLMTIDKKKLKIVKKNYSIRQWDYLFESAGAGCTYVFTNYGLSRFKIFLNKHWKKLDKLNNYDWFIYAFFRFNDLKWYFDKRVTIYYRQHSSNFMGANNNFFSYMKRLKMINNGWYKKEVQKHYKLLKLVDNKKEILDVNSRIKLIINFNQIRRKLSERIFLLICLIFFIY